MTPEELAAENEKLRARLAEIEAQSQRLATRLQELVNDSEARFAAIFRDAAIGILLIDIAGRVVMANPAASRILGCRQSELRGLPAFELFPSDAGKDAALFRDLLEGRRDKYRLERHHVRSDGTNAWASMTVSLIRSAQNEPEYALALLEDITERKEAEDTSRRLLQAQTARAEAEAARRRIAFLAEASVALASSLDPGATLDKLVRLAVPILGDLCLVEVLEPDGTVRRVTEAAADPFAEEQLRQVPRELKRPRRGGPVLEVLRTGKTRLIASIDDRPLTESEHPESFERIGGAARPVSILIVPLIAGARTLGAIVFGTTHKERAYSESDVALAEEFARRAALAIENGRLYQEAKEASRLKDDFLAVVSHELRTPLMPILGWSQLLRDEKLPKPTLRSGLEAIERGARAQAKLIDDLLDVSRIIAGKLRLEARPLTLGPVIEEALESVRSAAKAKAIKISCQIDPTAPQVMGDPTRLQQIVWNLVANAIKFTPASGQVEVKLQGGPERVAITVSDTGEGIAPEFLPHLFHRFRQAEAATTRKHGGLGLGLSIVRHLCELHGGTVSAYSPGHGLGSVFTVTLPVAPRDAVAPLPSIPITPKALPAAEEPRPLTRLHGLNILVVEDQPDTLQFLSNMLGELGANVKAAASAADAMSSLRTSVPDVLISDIGMPEEDGYALIQRIRALPPAEGGRVPAIALTAFARSEDRIRAITAGFQTHVPKPIEPAELAAVIANLVPPPADAASPGRRRARAPASAGGSRRSARKR